MRSCLLLPCAMRISRTLPVTEGECHALFRQSGTKRDHGLGEPLEIGISFERCEVDPFSPIDDLHLILPPKTKHRWKSGDVAVTRISRSRPISAAARSIP